MWFPNLQHFLLINFKIFAFFVCFLISQIGLVDNYHSPEKNMHIHVNVAKRMINKPKQPELF